MNTSQIIKWAQSDCKMELNDEQARGILNTYNELLQMGYPLEGYRLLEKAVIEFFQKQSEIN